MCSSKYDHRQVLALVGFRKCMDFFPSVFSQRDLKYLDSLMPERKKKPKGTAEVFSTKK